MEIEQKEGMSGQENSVSVKKSLFTDHKFMLLATLMIVMATLFVALLPKNNTAHNPIKPIITPALAIITATPPPQPSQWASSSAILKLEKDTLSVLGNINNSDYQDPVLALPNIETRVEFFN